jgi:hypothetical protein
MFLPIAVGISIAVSLASQAWLGYRDSPLSAVWPQRQQLRAARALRRGDRVRHQSATASQSKST